METREEVAIAVEGYADRRVAQLLLDLFGVGSLRYEQRRARVPEVMEAVQGRVPLFAVLLLTKT